MEDLNGEDDQESEEDAEELSISYEEWVREPIPGSRPHERGVEESKAHEVNEILLDLITICEPFLIFLISTFFTLILECLLSSSNSYRSKRDKNTRYWLSARAKTSHSLREKSAQNSSYRDSN